jgi:hypothetical protein
MIEVVTSHTLINWRERAIRHTRKAIDCAEKYDKVKPNVEKHIKDNPRIYGTDDFSIRKAIGENWTLQDLARGHAFHRDQANMLWTAITAEKAFREMIG